jgi:hypothetical protein
MYPNALGWVCCQWAITIFNRCKLPFNIGIEVRAVLKSRRQALHMRYREESAMLARRSVAIAVAVNAKPDSLVSSRAIDLWSLAVCSFCLTMLCHSLANMPESPSASSDLGVQPSTSSSGIDTTGSFKLFTLVTPRPEITSEDAQKP